MVDNKFFIKCLGFSQDPKTYNYIIVMELSPLGSLLNNTNSMDWKDRITALLDISIGLNTLHNDELIHQDFHPGNLLFNNEKVLLITDFGLCKPANLNSQSNDIYGVMPYVAPEVLKGKPYTKAADIYSFGMIMYFIATGSQPYANCAHDKNLATSIINGIRPKLDDKLKIPKCYIDLMKKCWDSDPDNRPSISEVKKLIRNWRNNNEQFNKAEEYRKANPLFIKNNQQTTHPQAIYTSRLLNCYTIDLAVDFTK